MTFAHKPPKTPGDTIIGAPGEILYVPPGIEVTPTVPSHPDAQVGFVVDVIDK